MNIFDKNERKLGLIASANDVISVITIPIIIIIIALLLILPRHKDTDENVKEICTDWKAQAPVRVIRDGKEVTLSQYTCHSDNGTVYKIEEE